MKRTLLLCLLFVFLLAWPVCAQTLSTGEAAGIVFRTLSAEDLDMIRESTGYRLGVEIIQVRPNTPGANAGYKQGDLILAVGKTGVDSAEKAVAAINAATGDVECASAIKAGDTFEAQVVTLKLGATAAAGQGGLGGLQGNFGGQNQDNQQQVNAAADPVSAYFDLMDFTRSQAWNRQTVTPAAERQRVAALLQQSWGEMDAQSQAGILQLPQVWANLQQQWKGWSEAERTRQKAQWREQLLSPANLYPPPANLQQFTADGNLVAFQYPAMWTGGIQEIDGTPFLFIGPNGSQASWQQVLDTPNSPAGALFALVETPAGMENMTWVQGAQYLIQLLMPNAAGAFKQVEVLPIGEVGAIITLLGKFPGQTEEKFYWIGVTQFGQGKVFAGRMGGPVSQADDLLPAFRHMLATLALNPPQATGGGGVSGAWEAAWSRVDVAITKNIWAK